ncbi:MAG: Rnf-Nqr domain containing protein [Spirochaetales bacterium]
MSFIAIIILLALTANLILDQFLGVCLVAETGRDLLGIVFLGAVVAFVAAATAAVNWLLYNGVLLPLGVPFFRTIVFVLSNIGLVTVFVLVARSAVGGRLSRIADHLAIVVTNSLVLGVSLLVTDEGLGFISALGAGLAAGIAFIVVGTALATIREQLEIEWTPKAMRGMPLTFLTLALIALAFLAFEHVLPQ